ncbi:hypothetical protein MUK42_01577 [Musa troglodytarum]|uniref:Uncharacterized protein n=1 Tax=Musa troglodytarum TaxID=320322 RepID=A0A9E7FBV1_9LILI|nr:hypothetical protein MUK42_01577 [Musa troglodytarum]
MIALLAPWSPSRPQPRLRRYLTAVAASNRDPSSARDHRSRREERGQESGAEMGGGMEVNKNKYIEDWNAARENLEFNFRWTRRNLAIVGIFGLAVPILVYKGIVREFVPISSSSPSPSFFSRSHMQDEDAGRPLRKFL